MKSIILLLHISLLLLLSAACDRQEMEDIGDTPGNGGKPSTDIPKGYFVVNFSPYALREGTRAPVTGPDARVQHLKYIIYKSNGEYVKERDVLLPSQGIPTWPMTACCDTLPKGIYKVVFLGNVEKTLFPYPTEESPENYADVLTNYQTNYSDARISLPPAEFSSNTEYYWGTAPFSDTVTNPEVLLQRIIGAAKLQRVFIDGEQALNDLLANIVTQIGYREIIQTTVEGLLPGLLQEALESELTGLLSPALILTDEIVDLLLEGLVEPATEHLYDLFLQQLVAQIGVALLGNSDKDALVEYLGVLLNPWNNFNAANAVVAINNYPRSIDFDLNVKEYYEGVQNFKYGFNTQSAVQERYLLLKNFNADYDVRKISVVGVGLIAGVVVNQVIDDFLLPGAFVDINDPILVEGEKSNLRYQADYSFLSLGLQSYEQQNDGNHSLTLTVELSQIANIDNILSGVLGEVLDLLSELPALAIVIGLLEEVLAGSLTDALREITISTSLNLPLLGIDNLTVSGSWGPVSPY